MLRLQNDLTQSLTEMFRTTKGLIKYISLNCCISNYHKCSGLKQYPMISSYFCRSEVQTSLAGLLLWVSQGYYQVSIRLGPSLGAVGKSLLPSPFVCQQILVLAADGLLPCCQPWATLTLRRCPHSFSPISASSRQHYYMESLYTLNLSDFFFCYQPEKTFRF